MDALAFRVPWWKRIPARAPPDAYVHGAPREHNAPSAASAKTRQLVAIDDVVGIGIGVTTSVCRLLSSGAPSSKMK